MSKALCDGGGVMIHEQLSAEGKPVYRAHYFPGNPAGKQAAQAIAAAWDAPQRRKMARLLKRRAELETGTLAAIARHQPHPYEHN